MAVQAAQQHTQCCCGGSEGCTWAEVDSDAVKQSCGTHAGVRLHPGP